MSARVWSASPGAAPIWPYHEFQLATVQSTDAKSPAGQLGCRIVTSQAVASLCEQLLTKNAIPCVLDAEDPAAAADEVYLYFESKYYTRAQFLIQKQIRTKIAPLPQTLVDILEIAQEQVQQRSTAAATVRLDQPPSPHIPAEVWAKLKDYQKASVYRFQELHGRMYNSDDPGLGKTLQAIISALVYKPKWPLLIVSPSSVKTNWCNELVRWLPGVLTRADIHIIESQADALAVLPAATHADQTAASAAMAKINAGSGVKRKKPRKKTLPQKKAKVEPCSFLAMDPHAIRKEKERQRKERQKDAQKDAKDTKKSDKPEYQVYIISYDLLIRPAVFAAVTAKRFQVIVSDESHFLKSPLAQRTVMFTSLAHRAPHVLLLSGTPGHNPEQLYAQIRVLHPQLFPPYWVTPPPHVNTLDKWRAIEHELPCTYSSRWADPRPEPTVFGKFQWCLSGGARLNELNAILKEFCLLKRTKDEVLKDLPQKVRYPIQFDVPTADKQVIQSEMAAIKGLRQSKPLEFKARFMKLWNDLPRVKTPAVQEYLGSLFAPHGELATGSKKILIFAHHKTMIGVIEDVIRAQGVQYIKITGETATHKRQTLVDQFQTNPQVRVAILSLTAAGVGLNLQAASLVVFTELFFGPDSHVQAEDRAHRLGQTADTVTCRYLVAKDTLDEGLLRMVGRKCTTSALLIEGRSSTFAMKRAQKLALSSAEDAEEEAIPTEEQLEETAWDETLSDPAQLAALLDK